MIYITGKCNMKGMQHSTLPTTVHLPQLQFEPVPIDRKNYIINILKCVLISFMRNILNK